MKKPLLIIFVLLILYFGGEIFFRDEKDIIQSRLADLAETASILEQEHPFEILAKAKSVGEFFTDDVVFDIEDLSDEEGLEKMKFKGRRKLIDKVRLTRARLDYLVISFTGIKIVLDKETAEADLTAVASGDDPHNAGGFNDKMELHFSLEKEKGNWLIAAVKGRKVAPVSHPER